jgi:hypothetical protein
MILEIVIDIQIIKADIVNNQYHLSLEQEIYHTKNIDTSAIKSHDNNLSWKCNVPQKIELGWSDPFTIQKFCSALRFISTHIINYNRTENDVTILQAKEKRHPVIPSLCFEDKAFQKGKAMLLT